MRIIHITAGIQETCGVSQYVVNTARAQQAAGHDVTIITTMTCGYPVADLKVVLAKEPEGALEAVRKDDAEGGVATQGVRGGIVVHAHSMWNRYVHRALVWCRVHGVPYVCSPHGATTPWAMHFKWWKKFPAWWLYQRHDFKCAAAFHVTVTDEEKDIRRLGFTQPAVIAPLGADVSERSEGEIKGLVKGQAAIRDVVFISRIHPKKNAASLIRAWALTGAREAAGARTRRLVIAGTDDVGHQAELVELAKAQGLRVVDFSKELEFGKKQIDGGGEVPVETFQERLSGCDADVVFTGPVYSAAKDWMFAHAWVSVLPSFSENFGGVVLESLAQGTPVIASKGTPWGELEVWQCGRWIEPTPEKLAACLRDVLALSEEAREKMARTARELVTQKYSWKASAAKVVEMYRKAGVSHLKSM